MEALIGGRKTFRLRCQDVHQCHDASSGMVDVFVRLTHVVLKIQLIIAVNRQTSLTVGGCDYDYPPGFLPALAHRQCGVPGHPDPSKAS